ncbi:MAG TPA: twin-arginine translocase TatA/TatE family subunit [Caldithrix abyssi]|uniref:Sec-independent protein translocase protein TatA n=1 Tax=Caldithrix abyssi TaxID=187145 RepID=A0A7V1LPZ0_CALAY|nr:twin-arginine translocase TatA/TatE family subunit [Caldithrix abyssi]
MNFGTTEILIIFFIIILLFGAKRLPDLARSLGSSIKQFKKGVSEEEESGDKE